MTIMDRDHIQEFHKMEIEIPFYGKTARTIRCQPEQATILLSSAHRAREPSVDAGDFEEAVHAVPAIFIRIRVR